MINQSRIENLSQLASEQTQIEGGGGAVIQRRKRTRGPCGFWGDHRRTRWGAQPPIGIGSKPGRFRIIATWLVVAVVTASPAPAGAQPVSAWKVSGELLEPPGTVE